MSSIKNKIKHDLYRSAKQSSLKYLIIRWSKDPGFQFLLFFRIYKHLQSSPILGLFSKYLLHRKSYRYGIQIPTSVDLGEGILIPHWGGIVINSKTTIGNNCTIMHNTTIGNTKSLKNPGAPKIGNNVYLGPGSVIVGNINIGNYVLIAPNAYVNFSVPDNCIVIGNPGKIIPNKFRVVKEYITNPIDIFE